MTNFLYAAALVLPIFGVRNVFNPKIDNKVDMFCCAASALVLGAIVTSIMSGEEGASDVSEN